MSPVTDAPPLQLLVGPTGHGVVDYASDVAAALRRRDDRVEVIAVTGFEDAIRIAAGFPRVHVHATDRLLGPSLEEAASNVERLARVSRLTITAHDVPQDSDGAAFERRTSAYARFFAAAEAVAVNSRHEQQLIAEHLPAAGPTHSIPLGARVPQAPALQSGVSLPRSARTLTVLLAGHIYPGKGHAPAIAAAARAARSLQAAGEQIDAVVVRAIGGPSAGHERDVEVLRADAARRGVRFEVTGFLDDSEFVRGIAQDGIPLAAHEHVSASRSMLDWIEAGRRPLVVESRYAREAAALRPGTLVLYRPDELAERLAAAWLEPERTWSSPGIPLAPTIDDVAAEYLAWWAGGESP